ncbi:hypothetical protein FNF31_06530 [Cafeteria roenbergensis]|uniref:Protein root UVB sensitive/RUS domain-containing protein n=3 Tax=Cafeteria roenbergensis TaxID=33653 RepID=A0A5A8CKM9_CAFRO|nr:hypothetical protein FNF31_06530 [Cafeteria roenbergensis]
MLRGSMRAPGGLRAAARWAAGLAPHQGRAASFVAHQGRGEAERRVAVSEDGAVRSVAPVPSQGAAAVSAAPGGRWASLLERKVLRHVLPQGYPVSVAPSYAQYAAWSAVGSTASAAAGVLSMQALLHAVGAGAGAVPMAAALQWVVKDGLGQLGGVLFVSFVNTRFDSDAKRWRFVSATALEAATLLEVLTPAMPGLFLPLAALANVGKNISFLSASATRAGIHQALATSGNLADVTARAGSQSIAASLAGTSLGIALSPLVGTATPSVMAAWACLAGVHLLSLHRALARLSLPGLNPFRAETVARAFWRRGASGVPSVDEVRGSERLIGAWGSNLLRGQPPASGVPLAVNPDVSVACRAFGPAMTASRQAWAESGAGAGLAAAIHRTSRKSRTDDAGRGEVADRGLGRGGAAGTPRVASEASALAPAAAAETAQPALAFGACVWRSSADGSVCLAVEQGAPWWVSLGGHLAATRAQQLVEEDASARVDARAVMAEAWSRLPEYVAALEQAGWWVGHPLVEQDTAKRVSVQWEAAP